MLMVLLWALGFLFVASLYMAFRQDWINGHRKRIKHEIDELHRLGFIEDSYEMYDEYKAMPSYYDQMDKFWVWDFEKLKG
jgi:hypothetical protein